MTLHDELKHFLKKKAAPLKIKFYLKDVVQVMVGASILAVPVGFTEETWRLGETLPMGNILGLFALSILFISLFAYYNYYRKNIKEHYIEFFKRVLSTYFISFILVTLLLVIIQRAPWQTEWILALKRTIVVTFPASMSAAVADMID